MKGGEETMKKGLLGFVIAAALIAGVAFGSQFFQAKNYAGDPPVGGYRM